MFGVSATYYPTPVSTCFPDPLSEDDILYLGNCADNLFRAQCFVAYCQRQGQKPYTAVLESTMVEHATFRRAWKALQERFFRRYGAAAIGLMERNLNKDGAGFGTIHAHLLVLFPPQHSVEEVTGDINDHWREIWARVHLSATGQVISQARMVFQLPRDGTGHDYARYFAKAYNRGPERAKFGRERNETDQITANVRKLALWRRNELPVRAMSPKKAVDWFRAEMEIHGAAARVERELIDSAIRAA